MPVCEHLQPELGLLRFGVANPKAEQVFGAVTGEPQHDVDRSFTDVPADLDVDVEGIEIGVRAASLVFISPIINFTEA